jgi:GNAT superfamily N-acetyltransferase
LPNSLNSATPSDHRAALRIIVIDDPFRNLGFGSQFLKLCERWLQHQYFKVLQTEASPAAQQFYAANGYLEMPFNNPDGEPTHPDDRGMGKYL